MRTHQHDVVTLVRCEKIRREARKGSGFAGRILGALDEFEATRHVRCEQFASERSAQQVPFKREVLGGSTKIEGSPCARSPEGWWLPSAQLLCRPRKGHALLPISRTGFGYLGLP